jgi:Flp pilus assembly protein TadG
MGNQPKGVPERQARAFLRARDGIAAVEFAFILPIMLVIYLGIVELSQGLRASYQLDLVAHAMADLTGQTAGGGVNVGQAAITDASIGSVFGAGAALMAPLSVSALTITISEVNIAQPSPGAFQATVNWTVSTNGGVLRNVLGCGSGVLNAADVPPVDVASLPTSYTNSALNPAVGPIIVADVTYTYTPMTSLISGLFGGANGFPMQRTAYAPVRNAYTDPAHPTLYNHIQDRTTAATHGVDCIAPIL